MAQQPGLTFFRRRGGSGEIRGSQIAKYLGAKLNPLDDYQDDLCIYVKMQPPVCYPSNTYLDILDAKERIPWLVRNPKVDVIASSMTGYRYLRENLVNRVHYIPQHHCNFERYHRPDRPMEVIGCVGGPGAIQNSELKQRIDIYHYTSYHTRQDVVEAYKKIDIQVIWRITKNPLKNALKIINAASFGIPTIAYPSPVYEEMEEYYYPATSIDEVIQSIEELRCCFHPEGLIDKAEEYHIDHIAELYRKLL